MMLMPAEVAAGVDDRLAGRLSRRARPTGTLDDLSLHASGADT